MDITGHTSVVGGGIGNGKACCLAFAEIGARGVLVADIDVEAAKKTADEAKAAAANPDFQAEAVDIDVANEDSVRSAVEKMVALFGRIDYCVHSAGIPGRPYFSMSGNYFSQFKHTLDVNVNGTYLVINLVSLEMLAQEPKRNDASSANRGFTRGTIVTLASVTSELALPASVQYTAAKHAILAMRKTAAIDNAAYYIRVNCICPSSIDNPTAQQSFDLVPGLEGTFLDGQPMGRLGTPEEVADAKSSFITGCGLIMDGGTSLRTNT